MTDMRKRTYVDTRNKKSKINAVFYFHLPDGPVLLELNENLYSYKEI